MKFYTRLGIYKDWSGNCKVDPQTLRSTSYDWYNVTQKIGEFLVFNTYNYSQTTCKHKIKVANVLGMMGVKVDFRFDAPKGLQNLEFALAYYQELISELQEKINTKGTRSSKNLERKLQIWEHQKTIKIIELLIKLENTSSIKEQKNISRKLRKLRSKT